jgi:hypothetical protein
MEILAATDTVSITNDSFSIYATDGTDETPATNNSISITINGQMFAPAKLNLDQNYPNPFNHNTLIGFDLPKRSEVTLSIYNLLGKEVVRLIDDVICPRGYNTIIWNGMDNSQNHVPAGIYFMMVRTINDFQGKKLLLLK